MRGDSSHCRIHGAFELGGASIESNKDVLGVISINLGEL